MALLGNIIWFVFGGWILFLGYALGAVIFFPAFVPLFRLALYSAWPFGRAVVTKADIRKHSEALGKASEHSEAGTLEKASGLLNVLWLLTFGWLLALGHLLASIANVAFIWLIVTIPNVVGHWKLIPVAFMPFNKVVVPIEIEREIKLARARSKLSI